jgi:glutamine amidotransferase
LRIALIDYGIGNLRSVQKALEHVGADVVLTEDPKVVLAADKVILPGVGAFGDGMAGLRSRGLDEAVCDVAAHGTPLLGICVGMQVMFEASEEMGVHRGLGLLRGRVKRFVASELKVPQTGWNQIEQVRESSLFRGLAPNAYAYFNHAFYCDACPDDALATTNYGANFASVVGRGRLYGIQFHPEKSQGVGLLMLKNFVELG